MRTMQERCRRSDWQGPSPIRTARRRRFDIYFVGLELGWLSIGFVILWRCSCDSRRTLDVLCVAFPCPVFINYLRSAQYDAPTRAGRI